MLTQKQERIFRQYNVQIQEPGLFPVCCNILLSFFLILGETICVSFVDAKQVKTPVCLI